MISEEKMCFTEVREFAPDRIFDCGQCFRWEREKDGSHTGIAGRRVANVSFHRDSLTVIEADDAFQGEDFWRSYFDLDRDYGAIRDKLKKTDAVMEKAADCGAGIRILRQEKWETLVSFILSSNNNIPRIKKNITCLAEAFGTPGGTLRGRTFYALPDPEVLAGLTPEDPAPCKLGYRAGYLIETAKKVVADGEVIEERLLDYCGVGPKVADCIALFSMGRHERFPIDVWVERVMKSLYGIDKKKAMAQFARETFGEYGGIAQQYLFYYMRYIKG